MAVASVVAASARVMGAAGVALTALVVVLLGIVSSGGPLGSEFLTEFYRAALAPWLPVAPAYGALRGALYFDGAGVTGPVVLLTVWAAAGILSLAALDLVRRPAERKTCLAHV